MTSPSAPIAFRWYQSLIVRVMALCAILVLCLLGSVYILTGHYYGQVVTDMETKASDIATEIQFALEQVAGEDEIDFSEIPNDIEELERWIEIDLAPIQEGESATPPLGLRGKEGYAFEVTRLVPFQDQSLLLTLRFSVNPQTEIVRAFKNRYLVMLTLVFVIALAAMVYLIAMTLRPLREFTNTCAAISEGALPDFKTRGSTGEVRALEETFNRMVASLRDKEIVETNLRQAQRLSAVGNLAAGVAHDVRNPLNAIKLLSSHALDTLESSAQNGETAPAARNLKTIRSEVNRLEEIVSGFLSLAKEEELRRELQAFDEILSECLRLVAKDAEARNVRLTSELRCGDTELMLDHKQWTRAIINVLINALEACSPGGRVRLFSRSTDTQCEVEIRDDGLGMPREVLERVFDPYYTTKATGTGLGLSITRGIVEEHGGAITISGNEGQGCQVLITVPREVSVGSE